MSKGFSVTVSQIPHWLDWSRLVGAGDWEVRELASGKLQIERELDRAGAAEVASRLRKVGIGGEMLSVEIVPPPNRKEMRQAATDEARRMRERSVGFSRKGTKLDEEARYSLTPEALALEMGERVRGIRVIDACAGAGGNAIGFARAGCQVVAVESDRERLAMARHNAGVYGMSERIEFVCADAREVLSEMEADLLFVDPPWGRDYDKERVVLDDLEPAGELIGLSAHVPRKWLKVPPSFDPATLSGCHCRGVFGSGRGDEQRVKFLLVELGAT